MDRRYQAHPTWYPAQRPPRFPFIRQALAFVGQVVLLLALFYGLPILLFVIAEGMR